MNMMALWAQAGGAGDLVHWIIIAMIIGGIIGIAFVIIRQTGIVIPQFIVTIFWIVLACVVGVIAVRYLANFL